MITQLNKLIAASAVIAAFTVPTLAQGPIVLGGDDLTDHGSVVGGMPQNGWNYIKLALEKIHAKVSRVNDGSVAALGSSFSNATSSNAGAAIGAAAAKAGLSVSYYDGPSAINNFFADLDGDATKPAIIWIAGTGAPNALDASEGSALTANANRIADFVNSGGGILSHGSGDVAYGWLFALVPGLNDVSSGSQGDLWLTPAGMNFLAPLTNPEINLGPWHSHFEGDFAYLDVLVRSATVADSRGDSAAVIIGGDSVWVQINGPPDEDEECCEPCIPCEIQWIFIILIILLLILIWLTLREAVRALQSK